MLLDSINTSSSVTKDQIANAIKESLFKEGFNLYETELDRPWGGYYRIPDSDANKFIQTFFQDQNIPLVENATLSPKIFFVAPNKQFSWQHHERRGEVWRIVKGPAGIYLSDSDSLPENYQIFQDGEVVSMPQGIRHRLFAIDNWTIVAEIWVHTDPQNPSDEEDITRLADDFGRS